MNTILYYAHDPMCSWCYAFVPVWQQLKQQVGNEVKCVRLLGGLAPDNDQPMDEALRERLQKTWRQIEQSVPGTRFNFDFWTQCQPRRSSYASCRAVIAAREQGAQYDELMTYAIQRAYYQQARNPSDEHTLVELAAELQLDVTRFERTLHSEACETQLQQEISQCESLQLDSFPSLLLQVDEKYWPVAIDYNHADVMLDTIRQLKSV